MYRSSQLMDLLSTFSSLIILAQWIAWGRVTTMKLFYTVQSSSENSYHLRRTLLGISNFFFFFQLQISTEFGARRPTLQRIRPRQAPPRRFQTPLLDLLPEKPKKLYEGSRHARPIHAYWFAVITEKMTPLDLHPPHFPFMRPSWLIPIPPPLHALLCPALPDLRHHAVAFTRLGLSPF